MEIVKYNEGDLEEIVGLFISTVHQTNRPDYSEAQLERWAPQDDTADLMMKWQYTLREHISYVAKCDQKLVGFADLTLQGQVNRIYVHERYLRQGIAKKLIEKLEGEAYELGLLHLEAVASITAVPFFEAQGYEIISNDSVPGSHIPTDNVTMQKNI